MLEWITATLSIAAVKWTVGGILVLVVGWLLNKVPVNTIRARIGAFGYGLGTSVSIAMGKHHIKPLAYLYRKTLEAFFIRIVKDIVIWFFLKFIDGLESDNKKLQDSNPDQLEN